MPGQLSHTTHQAIIQIAQLLNRDNTIINNLPANTCEGVKPGPLPHPPPIPMPSTSKKISKKVKPMTDEDFDKLLNSVKNRYEWAILPVQVHNQ